MLRRVALKLHGAVDELLDVDVTVAVRVQQGEDDLRLVGVDVQAGEVGLHHGVRHVRLELVVGQGARGVLIEHAFTAI